MRPTNCPIDCLPFKSMTEICPAVILVLVTSMNVCLRSGAGPSTFKQAVVKPLVKTSHLDSSFTPFLKMLEC